MFAESLKRLVNREQIAADDRRVELSRAHRPRSSRFIGRKGIRSDAEGDARTQRGSEHALLTALSQDHSIEVRLNIVEELAGKVDVSLHALLIAHLERIRAEAEETGKADLANEAVRLLSSLEE